MFESRIKVIYEITAVQESIQSIEIAAKFARNLYCVDKM